MTLRHGMMGATVACWQGFLCGSFVRAHALCDHMCFIAVHGHAFRYRSVLEAASMVEAAVAGVGLAGTTTTPATNPEVLGPEFKCDRAAACCCCLLLLPLLLPD